MPSPESENRERAENEAIKSITRDKLFHARTVMIFGEINMKLAESAAAQLLALDAHSDEPIKILVNSPGGHVESGDTIHDIINFLRSPVYVLGTGWVASAGVLIFLGAPKARRYSLPNTRFLIHQPMGRGEGPAADVEIEAREIIKMRERLNAIIARETGQSMERVLKDTNRNYWMSAQEAKNYGIVTHVIDNSAKFGPTDEVTG